MTDCLFCKMVSGVIKPDVVFEDDTVLAFRDINPQAPVHILIIPKTHIATLNELNDAGYITTAELTGQNYNSGDYTFSASLISATTAKFTGGACNMDMNTGVIGNP